MKTPISYYGGKQTLSSLIISLVPEHRVYCEPFFGGGAIFFAKQPAEVEIINDTNNELVNFYQVARDDFSALEHEISLTLYSRDQHRRAQVIYENPDMFSRVQRAWALWTLANTSYGSRLDGAYAGSHSRAQSRRLDSKRRAFTDEYAARLRNVQIESADALRIIKSRDTADTFFYIDPPYVGADQGHYDGYTQEDFDALLSVLTTIQGRFLLSSYRNNALKDCVERHGWHTLEIRMYNSMTNHAQRSRSKVEVLTANYPISVNLEGTQKQLVNGGAGSCSADTRGVT